MSTYTLSTRLIRAVLLGVALGTVLLVTAEGAATYTEFYAQNGGSNLNACSTTNNTAAYTCIHGTWDGTSVFTTTCSNNPSLSVSVGDMASVYIDGATVGVAIGRVTGVQNATNGTITLSASAKVGIYPTSGTGTRTIKVGGACQGPNAASGYPLSLSNWGSAIDTSSHPSRFNMKNDQTYSISSALTLANSGTEPSIVQGYTGSLGDGGKAVWDTGANAVGIIGALGQAGYVFIDHIFTSSATSGSTTLVVADRMSTWIRCVFQHGRGIGASFSSNSGTFVIESEAYDNNRSNGLGSSGFQASQFVHFLRCISHDNTGSNTSGFRVIGGGVTFQNCVVDTNGQYGFSITNTSMNGSISIKNCDVYNNTSDGINIVTSNIEPIYIENTNLIKNGGAGINNVSTTNVGYTYNVGYGSGTQANASADTLNQIAQSGNVTYASGVIPWVNPTVGNWSINLAAAEGTGRGAYTETANARFPTPTPTASGTPTPYTGTVGFPDIGAADANIGEPFPTPTFTPTSTPTATATATATFTPTPTATAVATATATPTAPIEVSYGFSQ